jgi:hypothetical protein
MNGYLVNVLQGQGGGFDPDILADFVNENGWDSGNNQMEATDKNGSLWNEAKLTATDPDFDSASTYNFSGAADWLKQKGKLMNCSDQNAEDCATSVTGGVDAVSYLFQRASVINEWAAALNENNIVFDYYTQWILTFPTKHYYVDLQSDANLVDDVSPTLWDPDSTTNNAFEPFHDEFDDANGETGHQHYAGESCDLFTIDMWNRDEAFSTYASPQPQFPAELCYETNVLVFDEAYNAQGLNSKFTATIPDAAFPAEYDPITDMDIKSEKGWASLNFYDSNRQLDIPYGILQERHLINLGPICQVVIRSLVRTIRKTLLVYR